MAISIGTITTATPYHGSDPVHTISHNATGAEMLLVYVASGGYSAGAPRVVTGITFNGDALTQIRNDTHDRMAGAWYYLLAPDQGTYNLVVTLSGVTGPVIAIANISGMSQSAPIGNSGATNYTNPTGTNITRDTDCSADSVIFCGCACKQPTVTITNGSGQTQDLNDEDTDPSYLLVRGYQAHKLATAGANTMYCTLNTGQDYIVFSTVEIKLPVVITFVPQITII